MAKTQGEILTKKTSVGALTDGQDQGDVTALRHRARCLFDRLIVTLAGGEENMVVKLVADRSSVQVDVR